MIPVVVGIGKPLLEQTEEDFDAVMNVNLRGAFLVATEVARRMKAGGKGGSIINIESILSFRQAGQIAPYAASKAGLTQLTKSMALELASRALGAKPEFKADGTAALAGYRIPGAVRNTMTLNFEGGADDIPTSSGLPVATDPAASGRVNPPNTSESSRNRLIVVSPSA